MIRMSIEQIEEISLDVAKESIKEKRVIPDWTQMTERQLWIELVGCILGSRVPFDHAKSALDRLVQLDLINSQEIMKKPKSIEIKISKELSKPIFKPIKINGEGRKFRYPNIRANQICRCAISIYSNGHSFKNLLKTKSDRSARAWLSQNCPGVGQKQASLFLRNVSHSQQLAIIDTHVLKFMREKELIEKYGNFNLKTQYSSLESTFIQYAKGVNINPGTLDLAIWAVMSQVEVGGAR